MYSTILSYKPKKMRYQKRYNKFSFETNCRICLTQSMATRYSLTNPLKGHTSEITIIEALEVVTNQKVPLNDNYPNTVCGMCCEFLKISYDFVQQYKSSMEKLQEQFGDEDLSFEWNPNMGQDPVEAQITPTPQVSDQKSAPVEILVGNEKYNIKDIVIVEDDPEESTDFKGFLKNLGKSVSASFVKKDYQKPSLGEEEPNLVIEKLEYIEPDAPKPPQKRLKPKQITIQKPLVIVADVNQDLALSDNEPSDHNFLVQEPCNAELYKNITDLSENEKNLLESALKLKYKCSNCNKYMGSLTRAKAHNKRCGKETKTSSCYICDKKFETRQRLIVHLKEKHLRAEPEPDEEDLVCKICKRKLYSRGGLAYHMKTHLGKRNKCDKCSKTFYTKSALKTHMQVHSREKTVVVCPVCGKGFHYRGGLFYHMKIHRNERNFQCSFCPRRFYTTNSVKRHELTHTGDRPYACQYCEKRFRSIGEKNKHHLRHTNEKPFKCNYCPAGFRQTYNKNVHMMTHGGDFECSECGKGFADDHILRFHLKTKHGIGKTTDANNEANSAKQALPESEDTLATQFIQLEGDETLQFDGEQYYITEYIDEAENQEASDVLMCQMGSKGEVIVEAVEIFE